ncbi:hypothetical protein P8452_22623 [Trifolium repens]|jgi:hypothetical protein|nr:hypothetical protein P8452_22623 [Trifolium repens]
MHLSYIDKMTKRASKLNFMFIVLSLVLFLMCQEIESTSRLRSKESTCTSTGIECHVKVTLMDYNDQGNGSPPSDDYGYDYDFYRKHGDIPSPGAGH